MTTATSTVEVRELRFHYRERQFQLAIDHLEFAAGEQVALIGPSGCGKTTFLHLVSGILMPASGAIEVAGRALHDLADADRRAFRISEVGLVFQEFELLEHLSVRENILLPYFINAALKRDAAVDANLERLLERTGIQQLARRRPRELSQGERQRVAICRALITGPSLILADEPTGNLDPDTSRAVLDLLLEEATDHGATLMVATHDHGTLERFARVVDFRSLGDGGAVS